MSLPEGRTMQRINNVRPDTGLCQRWQPVKKQRPPIEIASRTALG